MFVRIVASFLCVLSFTDCISIEIPQCSSQPDPIIQPFHDTVTGKAQWGISQTSAHMCHDDKYLHVYWWCTDDEIISTYQSCNDPLYNQDAVEIFLATEASNPHIYFQFQISPKGKLFFANILNPNLTCGNLGTEYKQCDLVFYQAKASPEAQKWEAHLRVDLEIVGRGTIPQKLKGNLFRIDKSTSRPTKYLALNPTMANPACFHKPAAFIDMFLT